MKFSEYFLYLAHTIFFRRRGQATSDSDAGKFFQAIGPNYDAAMETIHLLREQTLIALARGPGLDALGRDHGQLRRPGEPDDIYQRRLLSAFLIDSTDASKARMEELIRLAGYPESEIYECFRDGLVVPFFNGTTKHDGAVKHGGGVRWAEFKILLGIEDDMSFTAADRERIQRLVSATKPAHTRLVGLTLNLSFTDMLQSWEEILGSTSLAFDDMYVRPGFRHSGAAVYNPVLQHDGRLRQGIFYNRIVPGRPSLVHVCNDEEAVLHAGLKLEDALRIWAPHVGWQRGGLRYGSASALDQARCAASLVIEDAGEITESLAPVSAAVIMADWTEGKPIPHGVAPWPARTGVLRYHSGVLHRRTIVRDGSKAYSDRLSRTLGPRRTGLVYGTRTLEKLDAIRIYNMLSDEMQCAAPTRSQGLRYADAVLHGPGRIPAECIRAGATLQMEDKFDAVLDETTMTVSTSLNDRYPGVNLVHGSPDQPLHDSSMHHAYGKYAWRGDVYSGIHYHGSAPVDALGTCNVTMCLADTVSGNLMHGGQRLYHDGGGLRWKHHGNLLRQPFARHDAPWTRNGSRRYLEARARYSDLATMHDAIDRYGVTAGIYDGTASRQPDLIPENMNLVARRGYRRLAI